MSDVGKTGAQASVTETALVDDETAVATETPATETAEEGTEENANALAAEEGSEDAGETEGADDKPESKAKRRRERQKAQIEALKAEVKRLSDNASALARNKPSSDDLGPEPDRANFTDEAKYTAALAVHMAEKSSQARQAKTHETTFNAANAAEAEAKGKLFKERAMALSDRYPDIEAKVFNDQTLPMSAVMADVLMESEKGPEVAYYLSANREEAQRIKSMSPLAAAAALGRLEAKLSLPKPRTETKAPPPPGTVSGAVRGPAKNPENMTQAEYVAWRSKGGGEKRTG